jgi:hypothetical protein
LDLLKVVTVRRGNGLEILVGLVAHQLQADRDPAGMIEIAAQISRPLSAIEAAENGVIGAADKFLDRGGFRATLKCAHPFERGCGLSR